MRKFLAPTRAMSLMGACLACMAVCRQAEAQSQSLFGNQSLGRSGGTSNSLFGNSSGTGARGTGRNANVANSGFLQTAGLGQTGAMFDQGFVGRGNNNGFVGRSATGQLNNQGRNTRQQRFGQNSGRNFGRGNRGNRDSDANGDMNGAAGASAARMQIRPRHEVAFEYPRPGSNDVSSSLRSRVSDLSVRHPEFAGVQFKFDDTSGEATLSGTVKSERDAKLALAMFRQEPGVRSVRNELSVAAATPTPPSPANP